MHSLTKLLYAGAITALATMPALAQEMMPKGEGMMIMSNGQMTTMKSMDAKSQAAMMKAAKPLKDCVVMMMGSDGKMYMMQESDKKCGEAAKM
jgi:hypothetical protein